MFNVIKVISESRVLFSNGEKFIVASYSNSALDPEVLLFDASSEGKITGWTEIFGEKHLREAKAIDAIFSTVGTYNKLLENNDYNGAWL
jgi:hypothetical protein